MKSIFFSLKIACVYSAFSAGIALNVAAQTKTELDEKDVLKQAQVFHIMFAEKEGANLAFLALQELPESMRLTEFQKLARLRSLDTRSKNESGNLGIITQGQMSPELDAAIFLQTTKTISKPFQSQFGWHLLYVDAFIDVPIRKICRDSLRENIKNIPQSELRALKLTQDFYSMSNPDSKIHHFLGNEWEKPWEAENGDLNSQRLERSTSNKVSLISHTEYKHAKFDQENYFERLYHQESSKGFCARSIRIEYSINCEDGKMYYEGYSSYELRGGTGRLIRSGSIKAPQRVLVELIAKRDKPLIESACTNRKIDVDYF